MATVREIAGYLEERVPSSLKLDFDNVGLLCGFPEREVSRVLVVLDITQQAIEEALSLHAELIVSHHPVIFTPLRRVCTDTRCRFQSSSLRRAQRSPRPICDITTPDAV